MEQTLLKLFWGTIAPSEYSSTNIPEHRERRWQIAKKHDALFKKLESIDPALGQEVEEILSEQLEFDELEVPEAFCDGFRLGARIMLDVLTENDRSS